MTGSESDLLLSSIPQPYLLCTLFSELPVVLYKPLFPPFHHFAITHHGEVFQLQPLRTLLVGDSHIIHPETVCQHKYKSNGRAYVSVPSVYGSRLFYVDRLLLDRFLNIPHTDRLNVYYKDGNTRNLQLANLTIERR